jgi:hypothetical protein
MSLQLRRGTNLERQSVVLREGELIYTTDTKVLYVGDGTTLGGVAVGSGPGFGGSLGSNINLNGFEINGLGDIDITGTISATAFVGITLETLEDVNISIINEDDVISFAGSQFTNRSIEDITFGKNLTASILSTDGSSVIINADTSDISGTLTGSVRYENGSILVDNITGILSVNGFFNEGPFEFTSDTTTTVKIISDDDFGVFKLERRSAASLIGTPDVLGSVFFERFDNINGESIRALISGYEDSLLLGAGNILLEQNFAILKAGKFGIGTYEPTQALDVRGNIVSTGYTQFGSYTTTQRGFIVPANGMIIYNSTTNRFQGYQNGGWINLDDGSAA